MSVYWKRWCGSVASAPIHAPWSAPSTTSYVGLAPGGYWSSRVPGYGRGTWQRCATIDRDGGHLVVLVDTSVWVEVFRKSTSFRLEDAVELDEVVTCLPVIQEVLQGFADDRAFAAARDAMTALPIVESPLAAAVFDEAVSLYRMARRAGYTVRSGVDCVIGVCALRHGLTVLHHDRDFDALARVSSLRARTIRLGAARPRRR
jgi:hypothetical protein